MASRSRLFLEAMEANNRDDNVTALRLMKAAAEQGDPVACFVAAFWHSGREEGFPANRERCKFWLGKLEDLAEADNGEAQWELGQHLRFGNLFSRSTELANYWLERAAKNGYGEAQHHLAWYLETGQYGYPVDPRRFRVMVRPGFQTRASGDAIPVCHKAVYRRSPDRRGAAAAEEGG
ncbi:tetratricopeptide repeat protein [Bradyrhizobium algeriense]|uniref:tetratricopeptide repeat protein n=1 Tax=Bradyrhizobium algeriense TaxID=634784 RepID=UPI000D35BB43|nr:SEL1-like repeat protein [Bradyrhizobium algeriense]